jgi:hypothetical protein
MQHALTGQLGEHATGDRFCASNLWDAALDDLPLDD